MPSINVSTEVGGFMPPRWTEAQFIYNKAWIAYCERSREGDYAVPYAAVVMAMHSLKAEMPENLITVPDLLIQLAESGMYYPDVKADAIRWIKRNRL